MNAIKRFFQEDIPAVFSAGKWRISLMQLKSRLGQLEKQRNATLSELGAKAWESRVRDERYAAVYSKLEELDAALGETQREIDEKQAAINRETDHLNSTKLEFDNRIKNTQNQRQVAQQKLSQLQATQKSIESRIHQLQAAVNQSTTNVQNMQRQIEQLRSSDQPDKEAKIASLQETIASTQMQATQAGPQIETAKTELAANGVEQTPVQKEIEGLNQLLQMVQEQGRASVSALQENVKRLQQELLKITEKKNGLQGQMAALMPDLGNQVYRHRPAADALSPAYARVDGVNAEIRGVNDQVNLTQARLGSLNSRSLQKVLLVGGALLFLLVCLVVGATVVVPAVSNALKPDPKKDIRLVEGWTLENCSLYGTADGTYLDISVWENRRGDVSAMAEAETRLMGSNDVVLDAQNNTMELAPDGRAVSVTQLNAQGSRVQEVLRTVEYAQFHETSMTPDKDLAVETFFEKTLNSENSMLHLEITNNSDFRLDAVDSAFAFVVNRQNEVIDILIGGLDNTLGAGDLAQVQFQSVSYGGSGSCLQGDYSQEAVTFWYFVPLRYAANSSDAFMLSGTVDYKP